MRLEDLGLGKLFYSRNDLDNEIKQSEGIGFGSNITGCTFRPINGSNLMRLW